MSVDQILNSIFALENPRIENTGTRYRQIEEFINTAVNGDKIQSYLAINANLKPKTKGILLYILTNVRLIKIEIGKDEGISSSSFFLNTMVSVDRKLIDNDTASIDIIFQNTSIGLRYPLSDKKITEFFQLIEQIKTGRSAVNE